MCVLDSHGLSGSVSVHVYTYTHIDNGQGYTSCSIFPTLVIAAAIFSCSLDSSEKVDTSNCPIKPIHVHVKWCTQKHIVHIQWQKHRENELHQVRWYSYMYMYQLNYMYTCQGRLTKSHVHATHIQCTCTYRQLHERSHRGWVFLGWEKGKTLNAPSLTSLWHRERQACATTGKTHMWNCLSTH